MEILVDGLLLFCPCLWRIINCGKWAKLNKLGSDDGSWLSGLGVTTTCGSPGPISLIISCLLQSIIIKKVRTCRFG